MNHKCTESNDLNKNLSPSSIQIVRFGSYFRKSDGQRIRRYFCKACKKSFSSASSNPCYKQIKRKLNYKIWILLNSGVSQRRCAKILGVNRKTVVRKFRFLAQKSRIEHEAWLKSIKANSIDDIQFDDLETSEHTKCKPLSVALAVETKTRKILSFQVSQMPAKGHLSKIAYQKYGPRKDERPTGWNDLFASLKNIAHPNALISSDENPHYPKHLVKLLPVATHRTFKSRRGCVAGQGELKKIGFDPLFALNHTCAMLRANLNRLFRRTWCTTKTRQGLIDHLSIYLVYHNRILTRALSVSTH